MATKGESVRVAVRVRVSKALPPKPKDADARNQQIMSTYLAKRSAALKEQYDTGEYFMCIDMGEDDQGDFVLLKDDPSGASGTKYHFQHCFYSHQDPPSGPHPKKAGQEQVFEAIGKPLLDRVLRGYNGCLFAYGQTGSGKTYTMQGYDYRDMATRTREEILKNEGIVPRIFRALGQAVKTGGPDGIPITGIKMGFLEIYNETVKDLLSSAETGSAGQDILISDVEEVSGRRKIALLNRKVRDGPGRNCVYDVKLDDAAAQLLKYYEVGNTQRVVASTNMNIISSRSHSIVLLEITTKPPGLDAAQQVSAQLFLVDLAGSERIGKTEATGIRAEEGKSINKSLLVLGRVIDEAARGRTPVGIRESNLTLMLKNAIGGDSITFVLGALGPSSDNRAESKNTLDFLDRAAKIKCQATSGLKTALMSGSESQLRKSNEKLLRQVEELQELLRKAQAAGQAKASLEELQRQLESKQLQVEYNTKVLELVDLSDEELARRMRESAEQHMQRMLADMAAQGIVMGEESLALLVNLAKEDDQDGVVRYGIPPSTTSAVGSGKDCRLQISGYHIKREHCQIECDASSTQLFIIPKPGAETRVNGMEVKERMRLRHYDRVCFGADTLFFVDLHQKTDEQRPTWAVAMKEVQRGRGLVSEQEVSQKLQHSEMEIQRLREEMARIKSQEERKKAEALMREKEEERRHLEQTAALEQSVLDMIHLIYMSKDLMDELGVVPALEATCTTLNTVSDGGTRTEVYAMVTVQGSPTKYYLPLATMNELVSYLQQSRLERDQGLPVEKLTLHVPDQPIGMVRINMRNLLYLCTFGIEDHDETSDGATDAPPEIVPTPFLSHTGKGVSGSLYVGLTIWAPVQPDEEDQFYSSDVAEVLAAWGKLRDAHKSVKITVLLERATGLSSDNCVGVYASFNLMGSVHQTEPCKSRTTKPSFKYERTFTLPVTDALIEFLCNGPFFVELFSQPEPIVLDASGRGEAPAPAPLVDSRPATERGLRGTDALSEIERLNRALEEATARAKQLEEEQERLRQESMTAAAERDDVTGLLHRVQAELAEEKARVRELRAHREAPQPGASEAVLRAELASAKRHLERLRVNSTPVPYIPLGQTVTPPITPSTPKSAGSAFFSDKELSERELREELDLARKRASRLAKLRTSHSTMRLPPQEGPRLSEAELLRKQLAESQEKLRELERQLAERPPAGSKTCALL